ncbi:unnamed protein product, partial [Mesorhabditis belari]|uniref:Uncharacterized protein n=1 Tax=Mesorhabditis belari TaxID=2138241 RepID=A0AAF3F3Y9_9BILA
MPPACGASRGALRLVRSIDELVNRTRSSKLHLDGNTMDLAAQKIMVLDMEEYMEGDRETPSTNPKIVETFEHLLPLPHHHQTGVCLSPHLTAALTSLSAFSFLLCLLLGYYILSKRRQSKDFN